MTEVEHGEELLRALKEAQDPGRRPHLVVCDQQMPGMTALDALERATKGNRPFPVLLMTVHRDAELLLRASRLNVTAVFRKPFEVDDLRTAVLWLVPREQRGLH